MKVLFLIDSLEGYGAEKSLVHIASNMTNITPVFVHIYRGAKLKPTLEKKGIKVYSLNLKELYGFRIAVNLLSDIITTEKPEILHTTLFRADIVGRLVKKRFPHLILVGSFVSNSYGKFRYSGLSILSSAKLFSIQIIDKLTAKRVDHFICNSVTIKRSNVKALRIPKDKVHVIYRGRNFEVNTDLNSTITSLPKNIFQNKKNIFLNVGRLANGKGQLDLLKAFKALNDKKPGNVLLIAGDGPLYKVLGRAIKEMEMEDQIFLLGYREDVNELFLLANFFVFPSYFEGLPGALIEATISKTPSIVSDIMENKECIPKDTALFFEPGNIDQLSQKMEEALLVKDWKQRTEKAFDYAYENFRIKCVSEKYEAFYRKIVRN